MPRRQTELLYIIPIILVPATFIAHNFNFYKLLLFYKESYFLCLLYLIMPPVLYFSLKKLFKLENSIAALLILLSSILFFFFGAFQDFLLKYPITRMLGKTFVLPFLFLPPIIYIIIQQPAATRFLRTISFVIVFFFLGEVGLFFWNLNNFNEVPRLKERVHLLADKNEVSDSFNIYHIIFDGYTSSPALLGLFGFSNPIDSFLLENGFYIAAESKSNYNFTPYSFSSTLNLSYLNLSEKHLERNYKNFFLGLENYQDNLVFNFFRNKGYQVRHYSILDDYKYLTRLGSFAPRTPAYSMRYQTLERIFLNPWLWTRIKGRKENLPQTITNNLNYYVQYNKNALEFPLKIAIREQKIFCFTHIFLPHEPYVFTKSSIDSLTLGDISNPPGYLKQVEVANNMIKRLVTELKRNKHNIIILQGDHGFRDYDFSIHSPLVQNDTFNAFYFPDQNYSRLYDSISLVNTYRVILDQYFGQKFPLLKDEYFIAK
jgi:hypothetical protein